MSIYGESLSQYLKRELRASREENMLHRERRFTSFIGTESKLYDTKSFYEQVSHFAEASPDSDVIEIFDATGRRMYPLVDPMLPWNGVRDMEQTKPGRCMEPCMSLFRRDGHHWRLLTHQTKLAGRPAWLLMAGSMDEHYDILNSVRAGYLLLLPLVLIGSVMGGYALSRTALLPVGRLTEKARSISLASLDGRLPVPDTGDELQSMAEAWNDLLVRLEREVNRSAQLTMDVSHDLRSAMTVILANAELSLRRTRTPEQYRETLRTIQQETTHVLAMLEDMLLAAQTGETGQQVEKSPVCFNEIVSEVYEGAKAAAIMKGQKLSFTHSNDEAEIWLTGNRSLLRRLVSVLVDNALKYTPREGMVALSLDCVGTSARLTVKDNGIGIPEQLQTKVFDRSFRADSARSRKEIPGSGLGLSIVKWIAEVHGLQISLASEVNCGSMFSVILRNASLRPMALGRDTAIEGVKQTSR